MTFVEPKTYHVLISCLKIFSGSLACDLYNEIRLLSMTEEVISNLV